MWVLSLLHTSPSVLTRTHTIRFKMFYTLVLFINVSLVRLNLTVWLFNYSQTFLFRFFFVCNSLRFSSLLSFCFFLSFFFHSFILFLFFFSLLFFSVLFVFYRSFIFSFFFLFYFALNWVRWKWKKGIDVCLIEQGKCWERQIERVRERKKDSLKVRRRERNRLEVSAFV